MSIKTSIKGDFLEVSEDQSYLKAVYELHAKDASQKVDIETIATISNHMSEEVQIYKHC